jgi:hypothetical protein
MKTMQKGYPYSGIKSREIFPSHIRLDINNFYDSSSGEDTSVLITDRQKLSFLESKAHMYHRALTIAEDQIDDILADYPFLPEDFGFKRGQIQNEAGFDIATYYTKGQHILSRISDTEWLIGGIIPSHTIKIILPSQKEAYTTLFCLGVIKEGEEI